PLTITGALVSSAFAGGISGAPAPFDKGGVRLALVSYLSQGDYFEAYEAGVAAQAKALGVDLRIFQGKQDAAEQVPQISQGDHEGARLVIDQALKDNGKSFVAGEIFVAGFRPLELRDEIWQE